MNRTLLIVIGIACAVITAAGIMWYNYNIPINITRRYLFHKDIMVRMHAIESLIELKDKASTPAIVRVIVKDSYWLVMYDNAIPLLCQLDPKQTVVALTKLLDCKDKEISNKAGCFLCNIGAKEAIPQIKKLLQAGEHREDAVRELGRLGAKEMVPDFITLLNDEDRYVRGSAAYALAKLDAKEAVPQIKKLLEDGDIWIRSYALAALTKLNPTETIPQIIDLMRNDISKIDTGGYFYLLMDFDAKEIIPEITKLLHDNNDDVRVKSVWALRHLGSKESIPEIRKLLNDENERVREVAEEALKKLGVPDKEIEDAKKH